MDPTAPDALATFVQQLITQLKKNGFPERRVAFPLERLYESAHKKGVSFNAVLDALSELGIAHEKTPEKVIFGAAEPEPPAPGQPFPFPGLDPAELAHLTPEQRMAAAMSALQHMSPEQLAAMRAMVESIPEEQRAQMMEQARKMGLL